VTSTEFGSSDVYRRFELPQPINVDRTKARLDKGVLQITAAKAEVKERPVATAAA
jgi:HSP20 family molecular chaperone IbpA